MTTHAAAAPAHGHSPHASGGMNRGMMGMVLFIASEVMLFGGLFGAYFFTRNQAETWPPEGTEHTLSVGLALGLTVLLISSSVIAHFGTIGIRKGNRTLYLVGIGGSIIVGTIFIAGQAYEWLELMDHGLTAHTNTYGSTFYLITGFHGAHVIAGLCMLAVVFLRLLWRDFTPGRHLYAEAAVLYWHFVDFIWIFVFFILYVFSQ